MKARLIVAGVGTAFLLVVLLALPAAATMVLVAALAVVGAHERAHAVGITGRLTAYTMVAAALVPIWCFFSGNPLVLEIGAFLYLILLFVELILRYGTPRSISYTAALTMLFGGVGIPLLLCALLGLRMEPLTMGKCLVLAPLVAAFSCDSAALFAGMLFGKHKLAPAVSPKKTVEGALGGLVGSVVCMILFGGVVGLFGCFLSWPFLLLSGVLGAVAGQLGDLSFSVIKRECGIKDYGRLLPGHGGVLDRFDSVIFTGPLLWLLWSLLG